MQNVFIAKIDIEKVRHLRSIEIVLSDIERKHLIVTGKNGSGKTSLLESIRNVVFLGQGGSLFGSDEIIRKHINKRKKLLDSKVNIIYNIFPRVQPDLIFAYIPATRSKLNIPKSIEPVTLSNKTKVSQKPSKDFLKYTLFLDYRLYGAKSEKNKHLADKLEGWFANLLTALREIYACHELTLQRDTKNLVFNIIMPNREPFGLHEMADGYAAFLDIYMELLMRFENENSEVDYDTHAIVLIDEVETHLHVELQKRILPFLTKMFPNVQFITTTHSPFVINSLENAIIFDLEKKTRLENPSFYSYETILESFLDTDMYSSKLKRYFERYKELLFKERSLEENEEFLRAKSELEIKALPSKELYIAFQELEKVRKAESNGTSI
ncbi:MAG: AAA family ATPase [Oscillospiraceae bacterium]|nr:AAA family ATPase [Oscillospiraceae bacterium]